MWDIDFKIKETEIEKMKNKLDPDNIGIVRLRSFLKYLTKEEIDVCNYLITLLNSINKG